MQLDIEELARLLASSQQPLQTIANTFTSTFPAPTHTTVCTVLQALMSEGALASPVLQVECLIGFYLCHVMSKTLPQAKQVMQQWLSTLELCVKEDTRKFEHSKYRASAKDFKKQVAKVETPTDADTIKQHNIMRQHTALKCFAFRCLLGEVDSSASAEAFLSEPQAKLDAQLDKWAATPAPLKEKLAELQLASNNDSDHCTLNGPATEVPVTHQHITAPPCRPAPVQPGAFPGELKYIVTTAPQQLYMLDTRPHTTAWRDAHRIVGLAAAQPLSDADRDALLHTLETDAVPIHQLDVAPRVVANIATHNPSVAAAIASKLSDAGPQMAEVVALAESGKLPLSHLNDIFLKAAKALHQIDVHKYIGAQCQYINSNASDEATVKAFAQTLHQLVNEASKGNRELYIPDSRKQELKTVWSKYSSMPEVATCLAEL